MCAGGLGGGEEVVAEEAEVEEVEEEEEEEKKKIEQLTIFDRIQVLAARKTSIRRKAVNQSEHPRQKRTRRTRVVLSTKHNKDARDADV